MSGQVTNRSFSNLSEEGFKKIQDLQAVVISNQETLLALEEAISTHSKGLELLNDNKEVEQLSVQFKLIIDNFSKSHSNLLNYGTNASLFLKLLEDTTDQQALDLVEALLKIVAFK